jgi:hypothetical protein
MLWFNAGWGCCCYGLMLVGGVVVVGVVERTDVLFVEDEY